MLHLRSFNRFLLISLALLGLSISSVRAMTIDTVISFSPGTDSGVLVGTGSSWGGASGNGTYDPAAVTALDGVVLGLGGASGTPGQITVSFTTGSVFDGIGSDLRLYDSFGLKEGITVEASADGVNFFSLGTDAGNSGQTCSPTAPCATDFDLSIGGLISASIFRLTAAPISVGGFPAAYDLDTVEALAFRPLSPVPVPAAVWLFGTALIGLVGLGKRRKAA